MPREAVHAFVEISPDKKHAVIFWQTSNKSKLVYLFTSFFIQIIKTKLPHLSQPISLFKIFVVVVVVVVVIFVPKETFRILVYVYNYLLFSTDESTNAEMAERIKGLSLPYPMRKTPFIFSGDFRAAFFMNPHQARLFASAEHSNVDLTFTGSYMPYLINVVTFDLDTLQCEYTYSYIFGCTRR